MSSSGSSFTSSSLGRPPTYGRTYASPVDSTWTPTSGISTISAPTTEGSATQTSTLDLGPPGFQATIILFQDTPEERVVYLGPWEVVGSEQRRILWQGSYQNELLEHYRELALTLAPGHPGALADPRRIQCPPTSPRISILTPSTRAIAPTTTPPTWNDISPFKNRIEFVEGSIQFQGDVRRKDLVDFYDVDVVWTNVNGRTDSFGKVKGIGAIQRLKLWRDRYTTFHSLSVWANKTDGQYREYEVHNFDGEVRGRDDRAKQLKLNVHGRRRSTTDDHQHRRFSLAQRMRPRVRTESSSEPRAAQPALDIRYLAIQFTERAAYRRFLETWLYCHTTIAANNAGTLARPPGLRMAEPHTRQHRRALGAGRRSGNAVRDTQPVAPLHRATCCGGMQTDNPSLARPVKSLARWDFGGLGALTAAACGAAAAMKVILAINAGSSSVKISVFTADKDALPRQIADTQINGLTAPPAQLTYVRRGETITKAKEVATSIKTQDDAFDLILNTLVDDESLPEISSRDDISITCHRIVHGGDYDRSQIITQDTYHHLEELSDLAPLHNGVALGIVDTCIGRLPGAVNVACFDSQFHASLPPHIYTYPINPKIAKSNRLRKYGFHGISYAFITRSVADFLKKDVSSLNIIALHLGSGASACAIKDGKSFDTSMGLTPLAGLPGATRSGSVDPSLVFHYASDVGKLSPASTKHLHISVAEEILNKKSGWKAMTGTTNFGDVAASDDPAFKLAFDIFVDRILGFIGSYYVTLGGRVDALVFAGGIGERSAKLRSAVVDRLACLGFTLDEASNAKPITSIVQDLGAKTSEHGILVCQTDEQLEMARLCAEKKDLWD
ncbi:putative acetate kinase [Neonectria ditissima]|uniref:Probable acetate kinase n=1 Tax=Neonectria ditissima TaxID=78410 RepID=A0A0P7BCD8_9HYPO|nr:putative acetate kinase [Neonectria ditissima]